MQSFLSAADYLALPRAADNWIVEPIIPAGGLVNLYAPPKAGKSFLAYQLALDVAQGNKDFLGFPIRTPGEVAYLQLDTPRTLWAGRMENLKNAGVNLAGVRVADTEIAPYPFDILQKECAGWLASRMDELKPRLIIVDTLRELHSGDENDSGQMKLVISNLVAATTPAAVLIISHSRKDNPQFGDNLMNDNRGSGYVAGRMDTVMKLTKKHLMYDGRAVIEDKLPLVRQSHGFFTVGVEEETAMEQVMRDTSLYSLRERAEAMSKMVGKSPEACRSMLRRRAEDAAAAIKSIG